MTWLPPISKRSTQRATDASRSKPTSIDRKVNDPDRHNSNPNRRRPHGLGPDKHTDDLAREAQRQQADGDDERPGNHEGAAAAEARRGAVGHGADEWLGEEAGDGAGDPDERGARLCEAQLEEVGRAVYSLSVVVPFPGELRLNGVRTGHLEAPREARKQKRQLKQGAARRGRGPYVIPIAAKASRTMRAVSVLPFTDAWPFCSSAFSRMAEDDIAAR